MILENWLQARPELLASRARAGATHNSEQVRVWIGENSWVEHRDGNPDIHKCSWLHAKESLCSYSHDAEKSSVKLDIPAEYARIGVKTPLPILVAQDCDRDDFLDRDLLR